MDKFFFFFCYHQDAISKILCLNQLSSNKYLSTTEHHQGITSCEGEHISMFTATTSTYRQKGTNHMQQHQHEQIFFGHSLNHMLHHLDLMPFAESYQAMSSGRPPSMYEFYECFKVLSFHHICLQSYIGHVLPNLLSISRTTSI